MTRTPNGIYMDPDSGLVFSPVHFTWMDTDHPAGTPRQGYPVEIQALWYAALVILATVDREENRTQWQQLSARVKSSIVNLFWNDDLGFLADCLHASTGESAGQAVADDALRPNQLLAITLGAVDDPLICRRMLSACEQLLVPGGIRSLADQPVNYPIEIVHRDQIIYNPHQPYQGPSAKPGSFVTAAPAGTRHWPGCPAVCICWNADAWAISRKSWMVTPRILHAAAMPRPGGQVNC